MTSNSIKGYDCNNLLRFMGKAKLRVGVMVRATTVFGVIRVRIMNWANVGVPH